MASKAPQTPTQAQTANPASPASSQAKTASPEPTVAETQPEAPPAEPKQPKQPEQPPLPPAQEAPSPNSAPRRKSRFAVPTHLGEVDKHFQPKAGAPDLGAQPLPPQAIDEDAFHKALPQLLMQHQDKARLYPVLKNAVNRVASNQWQMEVASVLEHQIILEHQEQLTQFMRAACSNPTIIIQITVDEKHAQVRQAKVLSPQQRLDRMREANPSLDTLIQQFNAIQEYS